MEASESLNGMIKVQDTAFCHGGMAAETCERATRSQLLPSIQCISAAFRICLLEFIPLSSLRRFFISLLNVILIRIRPNAPLLTTSFNNATSSLFFLQILVNCHGWQAVPWFEYTVLYLLSSVE